VLLKPVLTEFVAWFLHSLYLIVCTNKSGWACVNPVFAYVHYAVITNSQMELVTVWNVASLPVFLHLRTFEYFHLSNCWILVFHHELTSQIQPDKHWQFLTNVTQLHIFAVIMWQGVVTVHLFISCTMLSIFTCHQAVFTVCYLCHSGFLASNIVSYEKLLFLPICGDIFYIVPKRHFTSNANRKPYVWFILCVSLVSKTTVLTTITY